MFIHFVLPASICIVSTAILVYLYTHSNWSAKQRMSTEIGFWNENITTALSEVNTHQSLLMSAALHSGIDARALGTNVMARRLLGVVPLRQEIQEMLGTSVDIGLAQMSVQSTQAVLRIVFAPTTEDSLLYYPHLPIVSAPLERDIEEKSIEHQFNPPQRYVLRDMYHEPRILLAAYRNTTPKELHTLLRQNTWFNVHIAALAMKQAQMRFLNEQNISESPTNSSKSASYLAFLSSEPEEVRTLAALLYQRDDMMP